MTVFIQYHNKFYRAEVSQRWLQNHVQGYTLARGLTLSPLISGMDLKDLELIEVSEDCIDLYAPEG